jgi:hypothetical protein
MLLTPHALWPGNIHKTCHVRPQVDFISIAPHLVVVLGWVGCAIPALVSLDCVTGSGVGFRSTSTHPSFMRLLLACCSWFVCSSLTSPYLISGACLRDLLYFYWCAIFFPVDSWYATCNLSFFRFYIEFFALFEEMGAVVVTLSTTGILSLVFLQS